MATPPWAAWAAVSKPAALQAGETCQKYIDDAEQADDSDLATLFRDVQEEDRRRAERAKDLLEQRLS